MFNTVQTQKKIEKKNLTISNLRTPQKYNSPPVSPRINVYRALNTVNIYNPANNFNQKHIVPTRLDIPEQNVLSKGVRTPTQKCTTFKINLPKTPNQISETKYFKSNQLSYKYLNNEKKNQIDKLLFNQPKQDNIQTIDFLNLKNQFRNSGQLNSERLLPSCEYQKTDRMPRTFDHFYEQFDKLSSKQLNEQKKTNQLLYRKPSINLKETSSTLSTINLNTKNSQQNLIKNYKIRQKISINKLSKSDFIELKYMGKGKFGDVHMVKHKATGFIAALKSIKKKQIIQQKLINQIIRQLKIQSYLKHPNIIQFYGNFQDKDNIYILLQLGSEGQLYNKLKEKQTYSEQATAFIIKSLLSAVQYMHSKKLIHRDIKPQNIVIVQGIVKLCDFGWAVYRGNDLRSTFCGTPLYVSPQILKGNSYDEKTDLWAIGILAYELVIGTIPFQINREQQLKKIITDEIKFPKDLQLSDEYKDFVLKILRKDPKQRLKCQDLLRHPFIQRYNQFETCEQLCDD